MELKKRFSDAMQVKQELLLYMTAMGIIMYCTHTPDRNLVVWIQGLTFLTLLFYFSLRTESDNRWILRLKEMGITPHTYTYNKVAHFNSVYVLLSFGPSPNSSCSMPSCLSLSSYAYIGSTGDGIAARQGNRISKFKQLLHAKLVKVELALRWFLDKMNFKQFVPVVIALKPSYESAEVHEHQLIEAWQTKLNFPFINKFLSHKALGFCRVRPTTKHGYSANGERLFRKVRKRLKTKKVFRSKTLEGQSAWRILLDLSSLTARSFNAEKLIRSKQITEYELYGLYRLASNLEQPHQSKAISAIRSALVFRRLTVPNSNRSIAVPFLAHPEHKLQLTAFLKRLVKDNLEHAIPFHLPACSPIEASSPKLCDALWSWKDWLAQPGQHVCCTCPCQSILQDHPELELTDGHITSSASLLNLSPELQEVASSNMKASYYVGKTFYTHNTLPEFQKWLAHHGLPAHLSSQWQSHIDAVWPQHLSAMEEQQCYSWKQVQKLKAITKDLVCHNADHEAGHLMLYCPLFYYQQIKKTWEDPELFSPVPVTISEFISTIDDRVPGALRKLYPWGFRSKWSIPYGYAFLKRKKQFKKVRTIIAYQNCIMAPMLKALSYILFFILQSTWPESEGLESMPVTFKRLHQFFQDSTERLLVENNDDLVGFFNSVPQSRILQAVEQLLSDFLAKFCQHTPKNGVCFTVFLGQVPSEQARVFQGFTKRSNQVNARVVYLIHIIPLVQMSFDLGIFQALGKLWTQICGTSIGNQVSPVLSNIAVSFDERVWHFAYKTFIMNSTRLWFRCRYVDNRLSLAAGALTFQEAVRKFQNTDFYRHPVCLEAVTDHKFLGFIIDAKARTLQFIMPQHAWQFRNTKSAGSLRMNLSGFRSRVSLIKRYTYPTSQVNPTLKQLIQKYMQFGFSKNCLLKAAKAQFTM